jgi:hypothetical protein
MAQMMRSSYGGLLTLPQSGLAQPDLAGAYRQGFGDAFTEELKRAAYLEQPKWKPAGESSIGLEAPATYDVEKQLGAAGLRIGREYTPTPDIPEYSSPFAPSPSASPSPPSAAAPIPRPRPSNLDVPGYSIPVPPPRPPEPYTEDRVPYLQPLYDMGVDPRELHQIIAGESKWDPAAKGTGTASGLFQFVEAAAQDLGTKPEAIRAMSEADQVALYVRYLKRWGWTPDIPLGLMQAAPAKAKELSGKPDSTVVYEVGSPGWNANRPWRSGGGKGPITKGSIRQYYAGQSARLPAFQDGGAAALRSMTDQSAISGGAGDNTLAGDSGSDTVQTDPIPESGIGSQVGRQIGLAGRYMAEGVGDVAGLLYDPVAGGINYLAGTNIQPLGTQIQSGLDELGFPMPEGTYEKFVAPIARGVTAAAIPGSVGLRFGRPLTTAAAVGIPAAVNGQAGSSDQSVTAPEDFQFMRTVDRELPQLPTPEVPQMAGFDFSRRAQALQEKEAYMQRAMQLAGIDAYLSGNPSQLRTMQAEYAQLGNERALVAGVNALQAATMGDITPLRQFLANQYGTGNVQIYPMADGTLEIEVDGQSLGRATLADIRQQLLTDLDPATQKQMAVESDRMWEVALLGIKQMLDAEGRTEDIKVLSKPDTTVDQSGWYSIGNEVYEIPVIRTTIGGAETKVLGEPVYRGTLQRPQ